jgi:hypothetical protein
MRDWEEKEDARARVLMRIYGIEVLVEAVVILCGWHFDV